MAVSTYRQATEHIMKDLVRKKNMNLTLEDDEIDIDELPDYPLEIIRDGNNKVCKIIHAKDTDLEWSEELIRNSIGKVVQIKTVYPDESYELLTLIKDNNDKVSNIESKDVEVE
ncbi:hypothetical protein [Clostridium botulinum]|uniref:hypothetical protein n=1 Tax=Clostridium botulinum TaxID=1491 RepID=UPI001E6217B8|nr:hypothetical protein [Clostridium botulinum]MCD3254343.1 hypothetical protein [Clostridium botulinum C/D]MCD3279843.1 hypothetical protein [Clostridium botulinum C/D]MCD3339622.1 hypothetical protein [Clostridium botulinum C/D]MCD3357482.1 hypothetical protein [Clostridium botulinum C/D]